MTGRLTLAREVARRTESERTSSSSNFSPIGCGKAAARRRASATTSALLLGVNISRNHRAIREEYPSDVPKSLPQGRLHSRSELAPIDEDQTRRAKRCLQCGFYD